MVGSPAVAGEYGSRDLTKSQGDSTNNLGKADLKQSCKGEDDGGFVDQWEWIILSYPGEEDRHCCCW